MLAPISTSYLYSLSREKLMLPYPIPLASEAPMRLWYSPNLDNPRLLKSAVRPMGAKRSRKTGLQCLDFIVI